MQLPMKEDEVKLLCKSLSLNMGLQKIKQDFGWRDTSVLSQAMSLRLIPEDLGTPENMLYAISITLREPYTGYPTRDNLALNDAKVSVTYGAGVITHYYGKHYIVTYLLPTIPKRN
jgi:hypothetical protein